MSRGILFVLLLTLMAVTSCATSERGRNITAEEIGWIQKGITTRTEVVRKFGTPYSESPDGIVVETTTSPTTTRDDGTSTSTITSTIHPRRYTKAMYLHTKAEAGGFANIKIAQEQFWVRYDERGVVQDFSLDRLR